MTSREKTIVGILVAVIVVALIAIGILSYRLLFGTGGQPQTGISVTEAAATGRRARSHRRLVAHLLKGSVPRPPDRSATNRWLSPR
jgi:hypothetical protein